MVKNQPKVRAGVRSGTAKKKTFISELELPQRDNYIIMLVGVLVIIVGYIIMAMGNDVSPLSITISPVILFIGYCIIIPIGIMYRRKNPAEQKAE
jgi:hypothetical protein